MNSMQEIKSNVKKIVQNHINKYGNIPSSRIWDEFRYTPSRHTIKKYTTMTYNQLLLNLNFEVQSSYRKPSYTKSEIIASFKTFYDEFGYAPTVTDTKEIEYLPSLSNIYSCFSSFPDVIDEANIPLNVRGISREDSLKLLDEFIQEFGRIPTKSDLEGLTRNKKYPEYRIYSKFFGGIKDAVLELDYRPNFLKELLGIKDLNQIRCEIIEIIDDHLSKYNTIPGSKEWDDRLYNPSRKTIEKLFDIPFNNFLKELGFEPKNKSGIDFSSQQLIQLLIYQSLELGKTPTFKEMKNIEGAPHPIAYIRTFGSYENAIKIANLESNKYLSKEFLISEVERYIDTEGSTPSTNTFRCNPSYPGIKAYTRVFGSFNKCLIEMGITPRCCEVKNCYSKKCISLDGHICNSKEELMVDNFLYFNKREHEREVFYPYDKEYNKNGLKRCDFLIRLSDGTAVYIEYAGLISKKSYRENLQEKIMLCKEHTLILIIIYPYQLGQLETVLIGEIDKLNNAIVS